VAASPPHELAEQAVQDAIQRKVLLYDKSGEEHYYHPTDRGVEKRIGERLEEVRKAREAARERGEEHE
jgi:replication-associated recombination protein RarA